MTKPMEFFKPGLKDYFNQILQIEIVWKPIWMTLGLLNKPKLTMQESIDFFFQMFKIRVSKIELRA